MSTSTKELKAKLHEGIEHTGDPELLLIIKDILDKKYQPKSPKPISKEQRARIEESKRQIERGECYSNDEVNAYLDEWLKK